ncbi:hypothetical protein AAMO2058_000975900 [Amorphochlora amoebiformis]
MWEPRLRERDRRRGGVLALYFTFGVICVILMGLGRASKDFELGMEVQKMIESIPIRKKNIVTDYRQATSIIALDTLRSAIKEAQRQEELGMIDEAIDRYKRIVSAREKLPVDPNPLLYVLISDVALKLGSMIYRKGNVKEGVRYWEIAVDVNPRHYAAHINLGLLHANVSMLRDPNLSHMLDIPTARWHINMAIKCANATADVMDRVRKAVKVVDQISGHEFVRYLPVKSKIINVDRLPYGIIVDPITNRVVGVKNRAVGAGIEEGDWIVAIGCHKLGRGEIRKYISNLQAPFFIRMVKDEFVDRYEGYQDYTDEDIRWKGDGLFPSEENERDVRKHIDI